MTAVRARRGDLLGVDPGRIAAGCGSVGLTGDAIRTIRAGLCVFRGEDSAVLVLDVNSTVNGLHSEPSFHSEARYEFKVHFDGADREELTYRVSFADPGAEGHQALQVHVLTGEQAGDDSATGELPLDGRIKDWFSMTSRCCPRSTPPSARAPRSTSRSGTPRDAQNSFTGTTVDSIVLEVSHQHPRLRPGARIGVWAATKPATDAGGWRQINRAGHPMMWPIFWPGDVQFTNPADTQHVSQDVESDRKHIAEHITATVAATGTSADPEGTAYSFPGRNGRTLADNAPEVMLSLVTGQAVPSGRTPATNQDLRTGQFPYVVPA